MQDLNQVAEKRVRQSTVHIRPLIKALDRDMERHLLETIKGISGIYTPQCTSREVGVRRPRRKIGVEVDRCRRQIVVKRHLDLKCNK